MFVNFKEISQLAWADSSCFDKEGFLFVQEIKCGFLQQWKFESFVERLCRLRGNILFVLDINIEENLGKNKLGDSFEDNQALEDKIVNVIILEECVVKLSSEDNNKHFCFLIDFGKLDSTKSFLFATNSLLERNSWIDQIRYSSFSYLRSLYKICLSYQEAYQNSSNSSSSFFSSINNLDGPILKFFISCNLCLNDDVLLRPNLYVSVYYRKDEYWVFLNKSEVICKKICKFSKEFYFSLNSSSHFELKFKVFNVIERVTETKILIGDCICSSGQIKKEKDQHSVELDINCIFKESAKAGKLKVTFKFLDNFVPKTFVTSNFNNSINEVQNLNLNQIFSKSSNEIKRSCESSKSYLNDDVTLNSLLISDKAMHFINFHLNFNQNIFSNVIHSSFQFELPFKSSTISVIELMAESKYCFLLPQTIINIFIEDDKKLMNAVTNSLGQVNYVYQKSQMRVVESHLQFINLANESINELNHLHFLDTNFRSSTEKNQVYLQFVPVNFHLQRFLVKSNCFSSPVNNNGEHLDIWSVGAFTSQYLGYNEDGLQKLYLGVKTFNNLNINQQAVARVWKKMKNFFRVISLSQKINVTTKKLISSLESQEKATKIFQDIYNLSEKLLLVLKTNEINQTLKSFELLKNNVNNYKSSKNKDSLKPGQVYEEKDHHRYQSVNLSQNNIQACLISILSKLNYISKVEKIDLKPIITKLSEEIEELEKLASLCYAVGVISLEKNQLESFFNFKLRRNMFFSQALTSLIITVCEQIQNISFQKNLLKSKTIFVYFETLLSCYSQELGMLQDMYFAIEEINECVKFVFLNSNHSDNLPSHLKIEGNSHNLQIYLTIDSKIIPDFFECKTCLLIFNIGINDHSNLTEAFVDLKTQEAVNLKSFSRLENYVNKNYVQNSELLQHLLNLKLELSNHKVKNVRVLHIMEQITRLISGIRVTSCKSAKDRTSMAITLEEVRFCSQLFNFNEKEHSSFFQQMLDTLRSEGTRLENTRKNIGVAKYAFNFFQVTNSLPKLYRPPPGTYSNVLT